ncbi:hypothetical protein M0657_000217 [Pyricularia oryzae]|nr:hypothetical protein M9X92_000164 [Pyricularia oryzae]KAI7932908.1 hypothetical protein M0657_000217 [Pyricularia oryzae]
MVVTELWRINLRPSRFIICRALLSSMRLRRASMGVEWDEKAPDCKLEVRSYCVYCLHCPPIVPPSFVHLPQNASTAPSVLA